MLLPVQGIADRIEAYVKACVPTAAPGAPPPGPPKRLQTDKVMEEAWDRFFTLVPLATTTALKAQSAVGHRRQSEVTGASNVGADLITGATRWGSSINWSGANIAARGGSAFRAAMGRFVVPEPQKPAGAPSPKDLPGRANAYTASIWVGIDGHRAASPSLPQAGVSIGWVHDPERQLDRPEMYAWAQWWTTDNVDGEMRFDGFEVHKDDVVAVWVSMEEDGSAYFRIFNETTGNDAVAIVVPQGAAAMPTPAQQVISARPQVVGSAVSWVVERPMALVDSVATLQQSDQRELLYPLPAFGTVEFRDCFAVMGPPAGHDASEGRDLSGRRLIRMFRQHRDPYRSAFHSSPEAPLAGADGLKVRYRP